MQTRQSNWTGRKRLITALLGCVLTAGLAAFALLRPTDTTQQPASLEQGPGGAVALPPRLDLSTVPPISSAAARSESASLADGGGEQAARMDLQELQKLMNEGVQLSSQQVADLCENWQSIGLLDAEGSAHVTLSDGAQAALGQFGSQPCRAWQRNYTKAARMSPFGAM